MYRHIPAWLILATTAVFGCRSTVDADELQNPDEGEEGSGIGALQLYTRSSLASEHTESVTMDIGRVSVHIADMDVADEFNGEWVDLTDQAGEFSVVESNPADYLIAEGSAPAAVYDAI